VAAERVVSIRGDPCATRITRYTDYTFCCQNGGDDFFGFLWIFF